jgi:Cof subfamily protein (haloacid dehalogenase superfamily)
VWRDGELQPRTIAALRRAHDAGLYVVVVTGRMVQSVQRFLEPLGFDEALICYQGAVVVADDGTWLRHEPIPLELAREVIGAVQAEGYGPNVYVDDRLYVSEVTQAAQNYAGFQHLQVHTVGDVLGWLSAPPTKLVCVGEPAALDALEVRMKERFGSRLHISKSLPYFLEFAAAGVTKGSGLEFLSRRLGFTREETVAFGDGENDVELIEWAGYGIAVGNAHERVKALADWVCPPAVDEGVALVVDAFLDAAALD